ncbi:MAG: methyltransferase, partial [Ignavibacteria bacterium]|nr:methyltransferase [Ignavibacteria bacterium]
MNTFNINTFFPTPRNVIRKMLSKFNTTDLSSMTILEPSAGKGDILDYIKELYEYNRHDKPDMYAIEQDANLKFILSGKNYKVIADDFLSYSGDYLFDLIVMNPPFNTGAKHLLKAWDAMNEGHIVCLLNAETINNPYTEERKLLKT